MRVAPLLVLATGEKAMAFLEWVFPYASQSLSRNVRDTGPPVFGEDVGRHSD